MKEGRVRVRVRTRSLERRSSTSTSTYSFIGTWSSTSTGTSTSTYSSTLASKFALFGLESLTIFSHELWILSREIFQVFPGEQSHVVLARLCCLFLLCCDWLQRKYTMRSLSSATQRVKSPCARLLRASVLVLVLVLVLAIFEH